MAQSTITFTNLFTDGTSRTLTIGPFTTSKISTSNIKQAVKDLNSDTSVISSLYLSKTGANFQEVQQVKISTTNKTVII